MKIQRLELVNFRNYDHLVIDFDSNLNIIYGDNGCGKSNLIEAIYFLSLTKSFRTTNDLNLISNNKSQTIVNGLINDEENVVYSVQFDKTGKNVFIDNNKSKRISDYVGNINIILYNPLSSRLINDSPSFRRKAIDIFLSQSNKEYLNLLNSYNKILKQRNAYLKQMYINGNASAEYLNILTEKMISCGLKIHNIRNNYIIKLKVYIDKIYKNIFENGFLDVKYKSEFNNKTKDDLLKLYQTNYQHEIAISKTMIGIHHDDIEILLDNRLIKDYGSVGQQKNAVISYKLAELSIIKEEKNKYPILILDDLFSELDNKKINNIIKMLNKEVQTFITCTNIEMINKELIQESNIYYVNNNNVNREDLNGK